MLYPLMLLGLLGFAAPIIIHLIQRQRLKPQLLATLLFLDREDVANAFAPRPRDLLQLLLRLLLLGLFILFMGRLIIGRQRVGPRTMAVVLDQSMSMQQQVGAGRSLFQRHREQILELIGGMGPDDKMSLTLVGDRITLETGYLDDAETLRRTAEALEVSDSGALALGEAVRGAVNQLRSRREVNAAVLVFSDHQRLNFQPGLEAAATGPAKEEAQAFRRALERSRVKLLLIDENADDAPNLAIEQAQFSPERVYLGASAKLTTVVRNLSDGEQTARLALFEGTQAGTNRELSLAPGEAAHVDLVHRFESPVDTVCRVELQEDILPGDNLFHTPMRMKDRRQVLLVTPSRGAGDDEGLELSYKGMDLLAYALNPGEALGLGTGTYVNVRRVTPPMLGRVSLPLYSVIVLYGVADLPEKSDRDLAVFVQNGGGVYLIPDESVTPVRFNEAYAPLLKSFMLGQSKQPEQAQTLDKNESRLAHPVLLPLVRGEWGDTREVYFEDYFSVAAAGEAEVALRAANGDPLVVVVRHARGHVLLQLFSCDLRASSLPRSTSFVPMVQDLLAMLDGSRLDVAVDTMRVGGVHRLRLPEFRGLGGEVSVAGPEQRAYALAGERTEEARVEGLLRAGAYQVSHPAKRSGRKRWLTVNPVQGESSLTPLSDAEVTELFGNRNAARLSFADVAGRFARQHELLKLMAILLFLAYVVEAVVSAWQSRRNAPRPDMEGPAA